MTRTLIHWTVEDYHRMIASGLLAGRQVELIDGQVLEMAPELPIHRATYRRGVKYLEQLLGDSAVIFSAAPITLPKYGEPQPDICVVVPPESRYDERHPEPEDIYWLIEVSNSTIAYDLDEKAKLYAKGGIQYYWVLDIVNTQLWVHRNAQNGEYQSVVRVSTGTLTPLALPSIVVEVARLLG
ncbi:Uma2 family endonuclease [Nostoc sp. FACHB-152]|uniref:Uma2 family endonuclease n=1 Tax=unclassified Nostoc TaxID=2593658 RepID=UPI0016871765|nr:MULTISPECIES: Uma2 family endonuclease [unclassified Nostoc]MBD2450687.1 Uma2 family endonuclease [Nostoc sp. FACHB-152]MBD2471899.1 Uma2 family endonuclease [Nostoc sp. FACHB-145]